MSCQRVAIFLALCSVHVAISAELKLVQVLFRHGDRTPIPGYEKWYPTDPYIKEEYAPAGLGELTEEGRRRSFTLGDFLRGRYFARLRISEYSNSVFRVRSSDVDRCRETAKALLAALFPGSEPIPIYCQQLLKDPLFVGTYICPTIRVEKARAERSMRLFEDEETYAPLYDYLSRHLGLNATRYHAFILHHTLMAQSSWGLPLPDWTKKIYPSEDLERLAGYEYVLQSFNTKMKRVNGGLWIREFIENMNEVSSGRDEAKMLVYVGHETNVAGFLTALDLFQPHVPGFCSFIILEMYEGSRGERDYVRLFYKNSGKLEELRIPRCSVPCALDDFKFLTRHLTSGDTNKECGLTI